MTQTEKLTKIIEKAKTNGWKIPSHFEENIEKVGYIEFILLSHNFAKAFWPEPQYIITAYNKEGKGSLVYFDEKGWSKLLEKGRPLSFEYIKESFKHHLQQAVISDSPIDYYFDHLKEEIK